MEDSESRIQQNIVIWFRNNYCLKHHNPRCAIFSVPNESKSKREILQKKAIGMMSGVSDLIVVTPQKVTFVEVKTKTGIQSDSQKQFEQIVVNMGYTYLLVRSLEDFKNYIIC